MSMFGKMSVGVVKMTTGLRSRISSASTMKVYGRSRATLIIHMRRSFLNSSEGHGPREAALAHFANQSGPLDAQTCRSTGRTAHHPVTFPQCIQDVIALCVR